MDVQTQMNHSQDLADMHESIIKLLKQFKYVSNKMEKLLKKITAASQAAHPRSDDVLKAQRKLVAQCLQSATEAMSMEARTLIDGLEEAVEASTDMKE